LELIRYASTFFGSIVLDKKSDDAFFDSLLSELNGDAGDNIF